MQWKLILLPVMFYQHGACQTLENEGMRVRVQWVLAPYLFPPSPLLMSKQAHRHRKVASLRPHIFAI